MAQDELARLRKRSEEALSAGRQEPIQLKLATNARKREALRQAIITIKDDLAQAEENVRAYEQLYKDKLVSREVLIQKRREIPAIQDKIRQSEVELQALDAQDAEILESANEKIRQLRQDLEAAGAKLAGLNDKLLLGTRVIAQFQGRILEVLIREGDRVSAGAALATVEISTNGAAPLEILLYVPAREGVRIKPGLPVHISPQFARKEEFGYILGEVTSAATFPVTRDRLRQVLQNDQLVESLAGQEVSFEVRVTPSLDPASPSGYRWSSSSGYPERLQNGAIITAEIVVARRHPIALLFPFLDKLTGP